PRGQPLVQRDPIPCRFGSRVGPPSVDQLDEILLVVSGRDGREEAARFEGGEFGETTATGTTVAHVGLIGMASRKTSPRVAGLQRRCFRAVRLRRAVNVISPAPW